MITQTVFVHSSLTVSYETENNKTVPEGKRRKSEIPGGIEDQQHYMVMINLFPFYTCEAC